MSVKFLSSVKLPAQIYFQMAIILKIDNIFPLKELMQNLLLWATYFPGKCAIRQRSSPFYGISQIGQISNVGISQNTQDGKIAGIEKSSIQIIFLGTEHPGKIFLSHSSIIHKIIWRMQIPTIFQRSLNPS